MLLYRSSHCRLVFALITVGFAATKNHHRFWCCDFYNASQIHITTTTTTRHYLITRSYYRYSLLLPFTVTTIHYRYHPLFSIPTSHPSLRSLFRTCTNIPRRRKRWQRPRQRRSKASPQDPPRQHPGYNQARYPSSRASWRCQAYFC